MAVNDVPEYPWYQIVNGSEVTQGDILKECPVPVPAPDEAFLARSQAGEERIANTNVIQGDMIVLTQACDVEHDKVASLVLCPIRELEDAADDNEMFRARQFREDLKRGAHPAYHLLNKDDDLGIGYQVITFHHLYTLPKDFIRLIADRAGDRPRLLPPYREHLSQAFARYFMRVGLPVDIPDLPRYVRS